MLGYKYNTELEAIEARKAAADYMGLPHSPEDETIYWVDYFYSLLDKFWYITYVDGLELALGNPIEFVVRYPDEISQL